VAIALLVLIW
jgi:hypothetical protein